MSYAGYGKEGRCSNGRQHISETGWPTVRYASASAVRERCVCVSLLHRVPAPHSARASPTTDVWASHSTWVTDPSASAPSCYRSPDQTRRISKRPSSPGLIRLVPPLTRTHPTGPTSSRPLSHSSLLYPHPSGSDQVEVRSEGSHRLVNLPGQFPVSPHPHPDFIPHPARFNFSVDQSAPGSHGSRTQQCHGF